MNNNNKLKNNNYQLDESERFYHDSTIFTSHSQNRVWGTITAIFILFMILWFIIFGTISIYQHRTHDQQKSTRNDTNSSDIEE